MMMMITRLITLSSRRQLHTIVSREIIKPSSPTPSHLKTHNLSLLDQMAMKTFMPMVAFYPNTSNYGSSHDRIFDLKISLSQTLTKYYPFAGRHDDIAPSHVDCNDDGAEFLEASVGGTLSDFLKNSRHEDLDQFFPNGLTWYNGNRRGCDRVIPLAVQVNRFECGGMAVAVSLSHKVADGGSLARFFKDWAQVTRICSKEQKQDFPIDPMFISFPNININFDGISLRLSGDCITRSFVFSNSKINNLKNKVKAMTAKSGQPITNPTRVEVLNWLLYKCSVAAATKNNPGAFRTTGVGHLVNIRNKMMEPLPENTIGNMYIIMEIHKTTEREMMPESFIGELKKQKTRFQGLRNIEGAFGLVAKMGSETTFEEQKRKIDGSYICTSMCGYPAYEIDFGWGKPVKVSVGGNLRRNSFILMDAPNGDGIEAQVCLGNQDMAIIQTDPKLLEFC